MNAFKREIQKEQEKALNGVVKKLKASDKLIFKRKFNELNFKAFESVDASLDDALSNLEKRKLEQVEESIQEGKRFISARVKEILSVDRHGWDFVNEYQKKDLADDSDDDKRMRKALKAVMQERSNKRRDRVRTLNYKRSLSG